VCAATGARFFAAARDVEYCTTPDTFRYYQCGACQAVFLPRPPVDRLSVIYPRNYYSFRPLAGRPSLPERIKRALDARLFRRLLRQVPGERLVVLDVGGGSGWMLSVARAVSPRVAETHEVDIDETARADAEAAGHVFHCARIEEFETQQRFDFILMLNLIEHVADPVAVLRRMGALLSPAGLLLIKTPNTDSLDRRIFQHRNWGGFHCPRHWVLFTMEGLRGLATRCGLEPVAARYTQAAPQWSASIMAVLAARGWLEVSAERPMHSHPLMAPLLAVTAAFDFLRLPFARTTQMFVVLKRAA
jgi:2-polyprenyl-3-methyl-5-hydroxy-6-metoxy-1,4-benzoquinol methylase